MVERLRIPVLAILAVFAVGLVGYMFSGPDVPRARPSAKGGPEGFTFFDIGRNSVYQHRLRNRLEAVLGSSSITTHTPIDLQANYSGFLEDHLPAVAAFERQLNDAAGARVEHDTTRLTYRFAHRRGTPFKTVEITFYNLSARPLFFRITADDTIRPVLARIEEKYGKPLEIKWKSEPGQSLLWHDNGDILLASPCNNRLGAREYRIMIYFMENIQRLITDETHARQTRRDKREGVGAAAF